MKKKNNIEENNTISKVITLITIILILIIGCSILVGKIEDKFIITFPLIIFEICLFISLFTKQYPKLTLKERTIHGFIGLVIFITAMTIEDHTIFSKITYEYNHTLPFLWFKIHDYNVIDFYYILNLSMLAILFTIDYKIVIPYIRNNNKPKKVTKIKKRRVVAH